MFISPGRVWPGWTRFKQVGPWLVLALALGLGWELQIGSSLMLC